MMSHSDDIPVGTRIVVVAHADELLLNRTCEVVEVEGCGPGQWLSIATCDGEKRARGWVSRKQVARDAAIDRLADLYPL